MEQCPTARPGGYRRLHCGGQRRRAQPAQPLQAGAAGVAVARHGGTSQLSRWGYWQVVLEKQSCCRVGQGIVPVATWPRCALVCGGPCKCMQVGRHEGRHMCVSMYCKSRAAVCRCSAAHGIAICAAVIVSQMQLCTIQRCTGRVWVLKGCRGSPMQCCQLAAADVWQCVCLARE